MSDDFEIVGDDAREARIVAVVLGEASDFEREEVARLCEENPELQIFRRRMETVHGLVGESKGQNSESSDSEWKLSPERRALILEKLGEKETVVAGPQKKRRFSSSRILQIAACVAVAVILIGLAVPTQMKSLGKSASDLAVHEEMNEGGGLAGLAPRKESFARYRAASEESLLTESPASQMAEEKAAPVRKPAAPSSAMARVIAANSTAPTTVPIPGLTSSDSEGEFGDADDSGSGWGRRDVTLSVEPEKAKTFDRSLGRPSVAQRDSQLATLDDSAGTTGHWGFEKGTPGEGKGYAGLEGENLAGDPDGFGIGGGFGRDSSEKKSMDSAESPSRGFGNRSRQNVGGLGLNEVPSDVLDSRFLALEESPKPSEYKYAWKESNSKGLRSGDFAVSENSIDSILNNPVRGAGDSGALGARAVSGFLAAGSEVVVESNSLGSTTPQQIEVQTKSVEVAQANQEEWDLDPFAESSDETNGRNSGNQARIAELEQEVGQKEKALAEARSRGSQEEEELVELATEMHDYKEATREYESSLALLQELKLKHSSERVALRSPREAITIAERPKVPTKRAGFLGLGGYKEEAVVQVNSAEEGFGSSLGVLQSRQFFETQKEVVTAEKTLELAAVEQGLAKKWGVSKEEAVKRLKKKVEVKQRPGTDLLEIVGKSKDPKEAAEVAAAVSTAYQTRRNSEELKRAGRQLEALDAEIQDQKDKVEAKRKVLDTIVRITGRPYFEGSRDSSESRETRLAMRAEKNAFEMKKNRDQYKIYRDQLETLDEDQLLRYAAELPVDNNSVRSLHSEYLSNQREAAAMKANGIAENHPSMKTLQERTEGLRADLDSSVENLKESLDTNFSMINEQLAKMGDASGVEHLEDELSKKRGELAKLKKEQAEPVAASPRLLSQDFDDSIRVNPSLTHEHSQNTDEVRRLLYQAEGLYNLANYDQAEKQFHSVLRIDPYNKAARRWLERTAALKSDYYRAAYDHTRAQLQLQAEVDKAWELEVPAVAGVPKADDKLGLMSSLFEEEEKTVPNSSSLEKKTSSAEAFSYDASMLPVLDGDAVSSGASYSEKGEIEGKLASVVIPRIDFENTPLSEAIEYLNQKTRELDFDANRIGFEIVLEESDPLLSDIQSHDGSSLNSEVDVLRLRNIPLGKALEYIAAKTGRDIRVDGGVVVLEPSSSGDSSTLVTRSWKISPEAYTALMEGAETGTDDPFDDREAREVSSEREALENSGVGFSEGASVRYSPENGVLIVKNTISNLDVIDQITVLLEEKAKAAQETLAMDEKDAASQADSTFSLHVSDVSFKLAKAALEQGKWPETVRVEEFVNAFSYGERALAPHERVGVAMEQAAHPFLSQRNLLRVSLQTAATGRGAGVPLRLTVVLDKSGSMDRLDRATAVDEAFRVLVEQLNPGDKVTLVGFSRTPSLLADQVDGAEGARLLKILRETPSEGGTNVEEALGLALAKSLEHFQEGAQNRVILLTDGIANLGESVPERLMTMVEGLRKEGVAFDACGVGVEGVNDEILEALTRKGDGRYYLLGSAAESGTDFAKQVAGALRPAAQNVKVQVEWNPKRVGKWRLYGFEKHELKKEDFRNDSVDAAEMAAEEEGVALYHVEVKPDGEGPLGVARVRFLDVANDEMVEREWEIAYEGEAAPLMQADAKVKLAGVAGLTAEKLAKSTVGERVEWDDLLEATRQLKSVFPKENRVRDLERMIEQAKDLE